MHPWLFALALPATVLSLGLMGLVLASTFILYRYANALSNLLEYPVWIASGLLFSTSLLPAWTRPISWALPPYWGMLAIRHAALGGDVWRPARRWSSLLGLACLAIGAFTFRLFEHAARAPRDAVADMRRWLSVFFVGGVIAYRGLFNWIRPAIYIPTMLGSPLFQLIFFTKLGQYAHARERRDFYIVGNSVQVVRDVVRLRHDDGGRERALVRDARPAARVAGEPRRRSSSAAACPCSRTASSSRRSRSCVGALLLGFRPGLDVGAGARARSSS